VLGIPDLEEVRDWAGVSEASCPDADLQRIIDAELDIQARTLRIPCDPDPITGEEATYPEALSSAFLRRVTRQLAARAVPLGYVGDPASEFGAATLRTFDPEVARLENSYRIAVVS
jgi:hypothetical protein